MANSKQKKDAALEALLDSDSLSEAAEKAGIARRTLYGYIHNDVDFARAYEQARNRQAVACMDALAAHRERAYQVIADMLEDITQPAGIRLKAAQVILAAAGEQARIVAGISRENVTANKELFDLSIR